MGRTALYHDPLPFRPARTELQLDVDELVLRAPDGRHRRLVLHGVSAATSDASVTEARDGRPGARGLRRFVQLLVLDAPYARVTLVTPPEQGAVAPGVAGVPEAPPDAAVVEVPAWEALAGWMLGGGRLAGCSIGDLARLVAIATTSFAHLIGEVAAQRALELAWATRGALRSGPDLDAALQPLTDAARHCPRAAEALVAAQAHVAGELPPEPTPHAGPAPVPGHRRDGLFGGLRRRRA